MAFVINVLGTTVEQRICKDFVFPLCFVGLFHSYGQILGRFYRNSDSLVISLFTEQSEIFVLSWAFGIYSVFLFVSQLQSNAWTDCHSFLHEFPLFLGRVKYHVIRVLHYWFSTPKLTTNDGNTALSRFLLTNWTASLLYSNKLGC